MRLPASAHTSRPWRVHEFTHDFEVEDVWALPTPGGPDDLERVVELVATQDPDDDDYPAVFRALFALRWRLGEIFGWDEAGSGADGRVRSIRERLPDDLRDGPRGPDLRAVPGRTQSDGPPIFTSIYLTHEEWVAEFANDTVHSLMHLGWVPDDSGPGYHAQMAVLTKPNGWLGRAYMGLIKPFRLALIYPMLLRSIERKWKRETGSDDAQSNGVARRVSVTEPAAADGYDYADAYEVRLEEPDRLSPEEWVRAGFDATPRWIKRLAGNAEGFASLQAVESTPDVVVFEDSDPLMDTVLVGRNVDPDRRVFTTVLHYHRPMLARGVWTVVGVLHRRVAPRLVATRAGVRQS